MAITKTHSWSYSHTGHVLTWAVPIHVSISWSLWTCVLATCLCYSVYCILSQIQEFPRPKQCYLLESIYLPGVGVAVVPKIFKTPFNWVFRNDWSFILTMRHIMFMAKHLKTIHEERESHLEMLFILENLFLHICTCAHARALHKVHEKWSSQEPLRPPQVDRVFHIFLISSFSPIFPYLICYFL